jgi:hypothetical protein
MYIGSSVRKAGFAATLALASAGLLAACSSPPPQAQNSCYSGSDDIAAKQGAGCQSVGGALGSAGPVTKAQGPAVYSGAADKAAQQGPEGCQSPGGQLQARSPDQLAKALQNSQTSTYGKETAAATNAMQTCGQ